MTRHVERSAAMNDISARCRTRTVIHVWHDTVWGWTASEGEYDGPPQQLGWADTPLGAAQDLMYMLGRDPHTNPFVMRVEGAA